MYLVQRIQIYLNEAQIAELDVRARRTGRDLARSSSIHEHLARDFRAEAEVAQQRAAILGAFGVEPDLAESCTKLRSANRR